MGLQILGLNGYEEKVYSTLVNLGCSSAGRIAEESGVPQGKIYLVLSSLEKKGLIEVIPEKTKKFQACSPDSLMQIIKAKKEELEKIGEQVQSLKKIHETSPKEAVSVIKGKKNFYKVVQEMPLPKKYEYNIKYTSENKPEWINTLKNLKKRKVDVKVLARHDAETEKNIKEWLRNTPNIKEIDNEGVAMSLVDDSLMFLTMIKSNTTLIIRDEPTIKLFKKLFENYYTHSPEI